MVMLTTNVLCQSRHETLPRSKGFLSVVNVDDRGHGHGRDHDHGFSELPSRLSE